MKSVKRKMIRIKKNDYANTPSNKIMKKDESIKEQKKNKKKRI